MAWKYIEYQCDSCGNRFEYLAGTGEHDVAERPCEECGEPAQKAVSAPLLKLLNNKNSDFSARHHTRMRKRSYDHWRKQGRDEGIDRTREQMKKNTTEV